jgi:thiol:disulfide interchange protein DsbC
MKFLYSAVLFIFVISTSIADDTENFKKILQKQEPEILQIASNIQKSTLPNFYEVFVRGKILYFTADAKHYFFRGKLFQTEGHNDLTNRSLMPYRKKVLANIDKKEFLNYPAKKSKTNLVVITDTSCPYCQKFHEQVPALNKAGIGISYMLYPRAGIESKSSAIMQSAWCAKNPQKALTDAKNGKDIPEATCKNPIAKHIAASEKMGLTGTPMILLPDGDIIPGFVETKKLLKMLDDSDS